MEKDSKLDLRLPSSLKQRVAAEAARDNRSMASVIIVALTKYLSEREKNG